MYFWPSFMATNQCIQELQQFLLYRCLWETLEIQDVLVNKMTIIFCLDDVIMKFGQNVLNKILFTYQVDILLKKIF